MEFLKFNALGQWSLEKADDLDAKIKAKMRAEMERRNFTEADATRHVIERDRGDKIATPKLPKPKKEELN
jgi:hypothetical protein